MIELINMITKSNGIELLLLVEAAKMQMSKQFGRMRPNTLDVCVRIDWTQASELLGRRRPKCLDGIER